MLCIPHVKLTILRRRFLQLRYGHLVRSLFAGQLVQINSTILWQFLKRLHYDGIASCIGIDHWVTYILLCFVWCSDFQAFHFSYDSVIFKLSFPLTHAACIWLVAEWESAMNLKWYSSSHAKDRPITLWVVYSWIFAARSFPALSGGQLAREYSSALQAASSSVRY